MDDSLNILNQLGLQLTKQYVLNCKDSALKYIEERIGFPLSSLDLKSNEHYEAIKNFEQTHVEHIIKSIKSCDVGFQNKLLDLTNARSSELERLKANSPWMVKVMPSIIAFIVVVSTALLDLYVLIEGFNKGLEALNPVITLVVGYASAKSSQVLGYYFGSSSDNK